MSKATLELFLTVKHQFYHLKYCCVKSITNDMLLRLYNNLFESVCICRHPCVPVLHLKVSIGAGKQPVTVGELQMAKIHLICYIQRVEFPDEVVRLESNPKGAHRTGAVVKKSSRLSALVPFL